MGAGNQIKVRGYVQECEIQKLPYRKPRPSIDSDFCSIYGILVHQSIVHLLCALVPPETTCTWNLWLHTPGRGMQAQGRC